MRIPARECCEEPLDVVWQQVFGGHRVVAGVDGDLAVTAQMIRALTKCSAHLKLR